MWILHLTLVLLAAPAGLWLARWSSGRGYWVAGVIVALAVVALVGVARRAIQLSFIPPFSWVIDPAINPILMMFLVTLLFGILTPRLAKPRQRVVVWILAIAMGLYYGIVPILSPVLVRASLAAGTTEIDGHGVCLQRFDYTCGPAAGVTVLRRLGVHSEEGTLAVASHCGPAVGADGHVLAQAMTHASADKTPFTYRWVGDVKTLAGLVPCIVTLESNLLRGHYVAVLEITETQVMVGDPQAGLQRYRRDEFMAEWNGAAIVPLAK